LVIGSIYLYAVASVTTISGPIRTNQVGANPISRSSIHNADAVRSVSSDVIEFASGSIAHKIVYGGIDQDANAGIPQTAQGDIEADGVSGNYVAGGAGALNNNASPIITGNDIFLAAG
jgi:hypothetical protein